jgi:crotonobetainyl-CoA:carnitine CoA-transferase CaiB-like acyl-CoA transferase
MLAGLWRARREGVGCDCDVSLFETALHELMYVGTWVASRGFEPERLPESAHPSIVPFQNFRTADGWIVVACPKQKFWERLCGAIERLDLASNPSFADFAGRLENRAALVPELRAAFAKRTTEEWRAVLSAAGVPNARVNDVAAALAEPQVAARNGIVETEHPRLGNVRQVATPLRVGEEEKPARRAPFRGEHTEQVLVELCGYTPERVRELAATGALGDINL